MNRKFSPKVKKIIQLSKQEALRLGTDFIGAEHLLLGMIEDGDSLAIKVLDSMELDLDELKLQLEDTIKRNNNQLTNINEDDIKWSKHAEKVLKVTFLEAKSYKTDEIKPEHLMLSILKNNQNEAAKILDELDVDYESYRSELEYVKQELDPSFSDYYASSLLILTPLWRKKKVAITGRKQLVNPEHLYWTISEET